MYEAIGKLKVKFDTQTFPSGFTKREFVITTGDDNYPQDIKFELIKDKCAWLDNFQEGQEVTVNFDIRGNEYKGRYYVNLNCWKIVDGSGENQSTSSSQATGASNSGQTEPSPDEMINDDIPF